VCLCICECICVSMFSAHDIILQREEEAVDSVASERKVAKCSG